MPSKTISHPFQLFNALSVSGLQVAVSSVTNILYRDSVAIQFSYSGNITGNFDVQGSIDYGQGQPQSTGLNEQQFTGTWTSLALSPAATISSGSTNILVNANQLSFAALRTVYTNSSGTGTITGWTCAKSLGT